MTETTTQSKLNWRSVLMFLRDVVVIFVVAIIVSFIVKTFFIRSFWIPSPSMEQTLIVNDHVIVNQLVPELVPLERGDIVVFSDPGGWLLPQVDPTLNPIQAAVEWTLSIFGLASPDSNDHLIKRVIGLPGDTVECCSPDGKIMINGVPIDEPYISLPEGQTQASGITFKETVPADSLFVMGDNRYNSADSRYQRDKPTQGFVPYSTVVGKAFLLNWPFDRLSWLSNYAEVFAKVPTPPLSQ